MQKYVAKVAFVIYLLSSALGLQTEALAGATLKLYRDTKPLPNNSMLEELLSFGFKKFETGWGIK